MQGHYLDDCNVCGGYGRDVCGVCQGSGIPTGDCDCFGHTVDCSECTLAPPPLPPWRWHGVQF